MVDPQHLFSQTSGKYLLRLLRRHSKSPCKTFFCCQSSKGAAGTSYAPGQQSADVDQINARRTHSFPFDSPSTIGGADEAGATIVGVDQAGAAIAGPSPSHRSCTRKWSSCTGTGKQVSESQNVNHYGLPFLSRRRRKNTMCNHL
jgi:hypothetical protein